MFTKEDKIRRLQDMCLACDRIDFELDSFIDSFVYLIEEVDKKKNIMDEEKLLKYVQKNMVAMSKLYDLREALETFKDAWQDAESEIVVDERID